ncbi:MAG: glycosyltransferase [Bacteroidetes bacterium]|nr:glycosyltransferase [Bacteroidota bacterium]
MKFSIIIPSYNQEKYIEATFLNVLDLKNRAKEKNIEIEILVFDSESNEAVQTIISNFAAQLDVVEIKKDKGQYDAINKGILACTGDYWTWLNTDDTIDLDGFFHLADIVNKDATIDYIYGGVNYMDANGNFLKSYPAYPLSLSTLVHKDPAIFQPGSFFKTAFTKKIGLLADYRCCFDYEYVMRCITMHAKLYCCDFALANFRFYTASKTGSIIPVFIREQLQISKKYGRTSFSFMTWFALLRLLKHSLFPRG